MNEIDPALLSGGTTGVIIAVGIAVSAIVGAIHKRRELHDDHQEPDETADRRRYNMLGRLYEVFLGYAARSKEPLTESERETLRETRDLLR